MMIRIKVEIIVITAIILVITVKTAIIVVIGVI